MAVSAPLNLGTGTTEQPADFSDIDAAGNVARLYVALNGSTTAGQVLGLDSMSLQTEANFNAGGNENIMVDTRGNLFQAADNGAAPNLRSVKNISDRGSSAFDPNRDTIVVGTNTGLVAPKGLEIDTNRGLAMIADFGANQIVVFDLDAVDNASPIGTFSTAPERPWDMDYDSANDRLYIALTNGDVRVLESFVGSGFGAGSTVRTITPSDGSGNKVSVNLHGIVHNAADDELYLSDVGAVTSGPNSDGQLFLVPNASTASGLTQVTRRIQGPTTMLGNPVDIAYDGTDLYVAEKTNNRILVYAGFRTSTAQGDVPASRELVLAAGSAPESVAVDPGQRRDHNFTGGMFTIAASSASQSNTTASLSFRVDLDTRDEPDETIVLNLGTPMNAGSGATTSQTVTVTDNDAVPTLSISDLTVTEPNQGSTLTVFVEVRLDAATQRTVTVDFASADGSAVSPADFGSTSGTLTFNEGVVRQVVPVVINGDNLNEIDETFTVTISNANNANLPGNDTATVTVQNNDNQPNISIDDVTVTEVSGGGTVSATFTITLDQPSGQTVTVDYATMDGSATAPGDYTADMNTLTFMPGDTSMSVSITVAGDDVNEATEGFTVNLSNAVNAMIADGTGAATINDNDPTAVTLAGPGTLTEGDMGTVAANFTVDLSVVSEQTITVDFATAAGTANAGTDFTSVTQTVTVPAGSTSVTVPVNISGDDLSEINEDFSASISNAMPTGTGVSLGGTTAQTVTIMDDDPVSISIDSQTVTEGSTATYTVSLSGPNGQMITVDAATMDGSATAGAPSDYTMNMATLTFGPGETTKTFAVSTADDSVNERTEDYSVGLSNPTGNGVSIATPTGMGMITDNDPITLSITDVSATEGTGASAQNYDFTVQLRDAATGMTATASEQNIRFDGATMDDTAVAPADYTARTSSVTVSAGTTDMTFRVTVNRDMEPEQNEQFFVDISNVQRNDTGTFAAVADVTISDSRGVGSITDDDDATVNVDLDGVAAGFQTAVTVNEDAGTVTFRAVLDGPKSQTVTVPYTLNGGGTALNTADSSDTDTGVMNVRTYVSLNGPTNAGTVRGLQPGTNRTETDYNIGSNEGVVIDRDGNLYQAGDQAGTVPNVRIFKGAVNRPSGAAGTAFDPTVDTIIRGTATGLMAPKGIDVDGQLGLIFVADVGADNVKVFRTTDVDNVAPTATISIASAGAPWDLDFDPTTNQLYVAVTNGTVQVFTVTVSGSSVTLAGPTRTITPSNNLGAQVSVNLHGIVHNAATDELYLSDVGAITSGANSDGQLFLIPSASTADGARQATVIIGGAATTLGNPVDIAFDGTNLWVAEKTNDAVLVYNDFRNAASGNVAPSASFAQTKPESIALDPGTRRDHDVVNGTLTFMPGQTAAVQTFTLLQDLRNEPTETFTVGLGGATGPANTGTADNAATYTVLDNNAQPGVSIGDVTVTEGTGGMMSAVFELRLDLASGRSSTVDFATMDDSAVSTATAPAVIDFTALNGTVTFSEGDVFQTVTIAINTDAVEEPTESFNVNLSAPSNLTINDGMAVGTITDDDGAPTISITDATVNEGNAGSQNVTLTVSLDRASGRSIMVDFATAADSAVAPSDYQAQTGTLTFAQGVTTQTVTVVVNGDTVNEANEQFFVNLSNAVNASIADAQSVIAINDNDDLTISINDISVAEDAGNANFTVSLAGGSNTSEQTIQLNVASAAGAGAGATPGTDFTAPSSLTITGAVGGGASSATLAVAINNDGVNEADESYTLTLSLNNMPRGVTIADGMAAGMIGDNDAANFAINDLTITETNANQMATFTVTLDNTSEQTTTVDFAAGAGAAPSATVGTDLTVTGTSLTFMPGMTTGTINVTITGDMINEAHENFVMTLSNATGRGVGISDATGAGLINDNDDATIAISDVTVTEGNMGTVNAAFTVTLSLASEQAPTVMAATADGTATTANNDYTANMGTITFMGASQSETFTVAVNGDTTPEMTESFTVNLSAATGRGVTIADTTGAGTITDDDNATINLTAATQTLQENVGTVTVTATLDGPKSSAVTVMLPRNTGMTTTENPGDSSDIDSTMPSIKRVYTSHNGGGNTGVDAVTAVTNTPVTEVAFAPGANEGIVFDADGSLYRAGDVAGEPASIRIIRHASDRTNGAVFDANTDTIIRGSNTGLMNPKGLDVDTQLGLIFVADVSAGNVKVFRTTDVDNATPAATIATAGAGPWDLDFDPDSNTLYVAVTNGTVQTFSVSVMGTTVSLSGPTRTITPQGNSSGMNCVNAHGIVHVRNGGNEFLIVSDVGAVTSGANDDGAIFVVGNAATANGVTVSTVERRGLLTNLGNPVDIAYDGQNLIVAEKTKDQVQIINNILTTTSGNVAPNAAFTSTKPESVALDNGVRRDENYTNATLTFAPGSTSASTTFTVIDDNRDEVDEALVLDLMNATGPAVIGAMNRQTITVVNNDTSPILTITGATVAEDAGNAIFEVRLNVPSGRKGGVVTSSFASANGTAMAGSDYTAAMGTLTFQEGEIYKRVTVAITDDMLDEEPTETFTVGLTGPVNAALSGGVATLNATGTIQDNDGEPTLSIADVTAAEGDGAGTTTFTFTVTANMASGRTMTVNYATADGTATSAGAAADFSAASGTATIMPGMTTTTFTVAVNRDAVNEANETFTVALSSPMNALISMTNGTATATITDDDPTSITINDVMVSETGAPTASFTLSLSVASEQTITVAAATADATATTAAGDYTASMGTVTFAGASGGGATTATFMVPVLDDTAYETDTQTANVNLSMATGNGVTIGDNQGVLTITDDEMVVVTTGAQTVTEASTANYSVSTTGATSFENSFTVMAATVDGTAVSTGAPQNDFTAVSTTLMFTGTTLAQTVPVVTVETMGGGAVVNEAHETYTFRLSNVMGSRVSLAGGAATLDVTGTINDDDDITVTIADATLTNEGNAGTSTLSFTATRNGASEQSVTVNHTTPAVTGTGRATLANDYAASNGSVTLNASNINESATINVQVNGDNLDEENETFDLAYTLSGGARGITVSGTPATGTINDDDDPANLTINSMTVAEDAGTFNLTVTLAAAVAGPVGSGRIVTVSVASADGTARTALGDYTQIPANTLTFMPGETTKTVAVTVADDMIDEATQSFTVNLSGATNANIMTSTGTVMITDNDAVNVSIGDVVITETDTGTNVTASAVVTLSIPTERNLTVQHDTADLAPSPSARAGSDYTAIAAGTTTFAGTDAAAAPTTMNVNITILGEDINEPQETFNVNLSNLMIAGAAPTDGSTISDAQGVVTINDEDPMEIRVSGGTVTEDGVGGMNPNTLNFTVSMFQAGTNTPGVSEQNIVVGYTTIDGVGIPGAQAPGDFTATNMAPAILNPGSSTAAAPVALVAENVNEANETFQVTIALIGTPDGVDVPAATNTATGTINDNDDLIVALNTTPPAATEGPGVTQVFPVTLSVPTEQNFTVRVAAVPNTALTPGDFTVGGAGMNVPSDLNSLANFMGAPTPTANFTVDIVNNTIHEFSENYNVQLTDPTMSLATVRGVSIGSNTSLGTINDDDQVNFTITPTVTATEGSGTAAAMNFTVSIVGVGGTTGTEESLTVNLAVADGTATAAGAGIGGMDYTSMVPSSLNFSPPTTMQTVTVNTVPDTVNEANETYTVNLTLPATPAQPGVGIGNATGTGTITDDDSLMVTIAARNPAIANVAEGSQQLFDVTVAGAGGTSASQQNVQIVIGQGAGSVAIINDDFSLAPATLSINGGNAFTVPQMSQFTFEAEPVQAVPDAADETFVLSFTTTANNVNAIADFTGTVEENDPGTINTGGNVAFNAGMTIPASDPGVALGNNVTRPNAPAAPFNNGSLTFATVAGQSAAGDAYSLVNGSGITFNAGTNEVSFNGNVFGTLTQLQGGNTNQSAIIRFSFNTTGFATEPAIEALVDQIRFTAMTGGGRMVSQTATLLSNPSSGGVADTRTFTVN